MKIKKKNTSYFTFEREILRLGEIISVSNKCKINELIIKHLIRIFYKSNHILNISNS